MVIKYEPTLILYVAMLITNYLYCPKDNTSSTFTGFGLRFIEFAFTACLMHTIPNIGATKRCFQRAIS